MLQRLYVHNYRCLENFEFKLGDVSSGLLIGKNGTGKSTLFKLITGQEQPDTGTIEMGSTVRLGYVDQSRDDLNPKNNVWQEISDGLDYMTVNKQDMSTRAYVGAFNFKGADQQKNVGKLSGGERNRVHMAKMLKAGGNVLLLDEPTNDLDVETLRGHDAIAIHVENARYRGHSWPHRRGRNAPVTGRRRPNRLLGSRRDAHRPWHRRAAGV